MILTRLRTHRAHLILMAVSVALALGATELHQQRQARNLAEIQRLNYELEAYRSEQQSLLNAQEL